MSEDRSSTGSGLTEGTIITVFMDDGPVNAYNSSPLGEDEAFGMVVKNLTAIGTDQAVDFGTISSFGPMPTPRPPYLALAFLTHVKAKDSTDPRIAQFGRVVVFWIVTRSSTITKYTGVLKQMIRRLIHFYHIISDSDLLKDDVMKKIDTKLKIVEGGVESYYYSEQKAIESFLDLALVPLKAPIVLIDNTNKNIQILLRDDISAMRKTELRQNLNDHVKEISKGRTYKSEWVTDPVRIQLLLSKMGFEPQAAIDDDFEVRLYGQLTFEEMNDFFASRLTPRRRQLVNRVLQSIETKASVALRELAAETGLSVQLIEELLTSAIKGGLIQGAKIENGLFQPPS